jgi:acyl-CoA thioester hydrolase
MRNGSGQYERADGAQQPSPGPHLARRPAALSIEDPAVEDPEVEETPVAEDGVHVAFELPLEIRPEDIDRLGHVNNVVYLGWIQDAAIAHWRMLATPEQQAEVAWVVVRHEIDYKRPARPGDRIVARTWVGPATHNTFERRTEILRAGDRKVLAQARTLWCPIDPKSLRPVQVSADIRARFSVEGRGASGGAE